MLELKAEILPATKARSDKEVLANTIQFEDQRVADRSLIDLLDSSNKELRSKTIISLGRIGDRVATEKLSSILRADNDVEMRSLSAWALGEIEDRDAVSLLIACAGNASEKNELRGRAIEALGKIAANKNPLLSLTKEGKEKICDAVSKVLNEASKSTTLSDDERSLISLSLTALLRVKDPSGLPAVANQLGSPDAEIRWQAANALARTKDGISPYKDRLLPLLDDNEAMVRAYAARALGVAKDKSAQEKLTKLLQDKDERVLGSAITALAAIDAQDSMPALLKLGGSLLDEYKKNDARSGEIPVQQNLLLLLATALGNSKNEQSLPFLKELRHATQSFALCPEVEIAIAHFGEDAFFEGDAKENSKPGRSFGASRRVLLSRSNSTSSTLLSWQSESARAQGLGELKTDRAKKELLTMLAGKVDARAVVEILNGLAAAKVEKIREILLEQLKARDVVVRATAANLLGELGDSSDTVLFALKQALLDSRRDKMNDARIAILECCTKLKHPLNTEVLQGSNRDADYIVRRRAIELQRDFVAEQEKNGSGISNSSGNQRSVPALSDAEEKKLLGSVATGHDKFYWTKMADLYSTKENPQVILHTKKGKITLELFAKDAPMTVDNFLSLAKSKYFDGLTFMRVVPNFVIQGGDPRNDMNGGPGYQIRCEINQRPYLYGTLGMALSGKDTGGSQFFITHSPQPHLDGGYTVFGQVKDGMDTVNKIAKGEKIIRVEF